MPKRKRPVFEYKGLQGLVDSINNLTGQPRDSNVRSSDVFYSDELRSSRRHHSRRHSYHSHRSHHHQRHHHHSHQRRHSHHHHHRHRSRSRPRDPQRRIPREPSRPLEENRDFRQPSQPYPRPVVTAAAVTGAAAAGAGAAAVATNVAAAGGGPAHKPLSPQQTGAGVSSTVLNGDGLPPLSEEGPPSRRYSDDDVGDDGQPLNNAEGQPSRPSQAQFSGLQLKPGERPGEVEPETMVGKLWKGFRGLFPQRYQKGQGVSRLGYSFDGMTTLGPGEGQSAAQSRLSASKATSRTSSRATSRPAFSEKDKDEAIRDKRVRQLRTVGKIGLGIGALVALHRAWSVWKKSKDEKQASKKKKHDGHGGYSAIDDDIGYSDVDSDGGGGGGDSDIHGTKHENALKLKPPSRAFGMVSVPQGEAYIIERSGKYHRQVTGGSTFLMPMMDNVAFRYSTREIGVPIDRQICFTRSRVSIAVTALMFLRIEDPVAASYGVQDLSSAIMMIGIACLKKEIGRLPLTDVFSKRDALTERIVRAVNEAVRPWGIRCTRFEFEDLDLPSEIQESMEHEARAARLRNADILHSEGQKQALINKAEGEMQAQMRMSQARQMDIVNQAIGEAHAIQERGEAIANAMRDVAEAIKEPGGEQAMRLRFAEQYLNAHQMSGNQNSEYGGHGAAPRPHDVAEMTEALNSALGLINSLGDPRSHANPYMPRHDTAEYHESTSGAETATAATGAVHGYSHGPERQTSGPPYGGRYMEEEQGEDEEDRMGNFVEEEPVGGVGDASSGMYYDRRMEEEQEMANEYGHQQVNYGGERMEGMYNERMEGRNGRTSRVRIAEEEEYIEDRHVEDLSRMGQEGQQGAGDMYMGERFSSRDSSADYEARMHSPPKAYPVGGNYGHHRDDLSPVSPQQRTHPQRHHPRRPNTRPVPMSH